MNEQHAHEKVLLISQSPAKCPLKPQCYYFTLTRMAKTKKTCSTWNFYKLLMYVQNSTTLKGDWEFVIKLNIYLVIPLLRMDPRKWKHVRKKALYNTRMFVAVLFIIVKTWKATQMSINRLKTVVCPYYWIALSNKKEWLTDTSQKHYVEFKKSLVKNYALYDSIHMKS